jgi:hypothetical protein
MHDAERSSDQGNGSRLSAHSAAGQIAGADQKPSVFTLWIIDNSARVAEAFTSVAMLATEIPFFAAVHSLVLDLLA